MISHTVSQDRFKDWLVSSDCNWDIAATIRSPYRLNTVKLEKYCNSILQHNSSILSILYVIESDSDPFDTETGQESYVTEKIEIGTHAHLLVNSGGKTIGNPVKMDIFKNQPFWIPFWKKMTLGEVKNYIKYNLPKMKKDGSNWGIVLQQLN